MVPLLQRVTLEKPQSNQRALAPPLGTSLRLGVPERRLESVGNPAGRRVSRVGPWMARRGGPRIQAFVRAHRSVSEVPSGGARALWLLWGFSKVTRRKGGTHTRHHPKNGYTPQPLAIKKAYPLAGPFPICHTHGGSVPLITQSPTIRAL